VELKLEAYRQTVPEDRLGKILGWQEMPNR
jgi:hypothetical protein